MKPDSYFETYAEHAYEAYKKSTGGKTFDGRDMPTWEQIGEKSPHVIKAWIAAVRKVFEVLQVRDADTNEFYATEGVYNVVIEDTPAMKAAQHQAELEAKHIIQEGKKEE